MAEASSNDTIRQMLSGFNAMSYNLGLLPMAQAQAMAGASAQYQAPPPPPPVPHPSEAALQAMQTHQNMMQHTMQAAQMTRYIPPPSAPMPSMGAYGVPPSYVSPLGGGGGGFGGGAPSPFAGGGGYGGGGGGNQNSTAPFAPRLPSIFNPFAPTLPTAHFATPAMRNQQMMHHAQAQTMGMMAGIGEGAMGIGGSVVGGALGPLGMLGGAFLGNKVGGAISNMIFNPVTADYARGRQIQSMTSPFMVTGPNLNMATGSGLDPRSARDVASGIRHLSRDVDFERTGFNTQDAMRIMQSSASAGLMTGAQSPDQIVQKVKDISKTVSVLMKITGDPDVRNAIHSLGQMRDLGFQGLAAQAGAVSNRMAFARMAGQSPAQMAATMMQGAEMAGQYGLVGATGAMAGGFGAGAANVAASSGALNDLQLARAGGRAGLGQTLAQGQVSALNNDQYMLAAMGRDSKGRMTVDMDTFRKNQTLSFGEIQSKAADALRNMDTKGIFEWNTQRQEIKDRVAQQMRPGEAQMLMIQQAKAFQGTFRPGEMSLGTALQQTQGMGADQARSLELMANSRQYWQGLADQTRVQRREIVDQERANREQYRTQGLGTSVSRDIRGGLGSLSDSLSSPYRMVSAHMDWVHEQNEATERGERVTHWGDPSLVHDEGERKLLRAAVKRNRGAGRGGRNFLADEEKTGTGAFLKRETGRNVNRIGSYLGLTAESDANKLASIADFSEGRYTSLGESFGDPRAALARVQDVSEVGRAFGAAPLTGAELGTMSQRISDAGGGQVNAGAILSSTTQRVVSALTDMKASYGNIKSARAFASSDFKKNYIDAARASGMSPAAAIKSWEANKQQIMTDVIGRVRASGQKDLIEPLSKAQAVAERAGAVDLSQSDDAAEKTISEKLKKSGMGDLDAKTFQSVKSIIANHDDDVIALATATRAASSDNAEIRERGLRIDAEMHKKLGNKAWGDKQREAQILAGSLTPDTAEAFENMTQGTKDAAGVSARLKDVREAAGDQMDLAARYQFKQKLKSQAGVESIEGSVESIVGRMSDAQVDKLDKTTREAVLKYRKGGAEGADALDALIESSAATKKESRHSDNTSDKLDELEDRAAQLDQMAAGASDDSGGGDVQLKATTLFADAVGTFASVIKDLKGNSELDRHEKLSPFYEGKDK